MSAERNALIEFAKIGAPISDADMALLSASEVACYRWPGASDAAVMLRDAFMEGAAHMDKSADAIDRLRTALETIKSWSEAYPLEVFPEPDLKKAHALLQAGGMTLDTISAHAMRHVVTGVGHIARQALGEA